MRETGINRGGLYGFFVRGEGLQGTISSTEENSAAESTAASNPTSGTSTPHTSRDDTPPTSATDSAKDMAGLSDAVASKKRKRRSGEQADNDAHKRRKEEEKKQKAEAKREKALADETLDLTTEVEKKRARYLNRKASKLIKKAAQQEELSSILPHPSMPQPQVNILGEANGEANESEEVVGSFGAMHADRMMMIQGGLRNQVCLAQFFCDVEYRLNLTSILVPRHGGFRNTGQKALLQNHQI